MSRWTWAGTIFLGLNFALFARDEFGVGDWVMGVLYLLCAPVPMFWALTAYREGQRNVWARIDALLDKHTG